MEHLCNQPDLRSAIIEDCSYLTPELALKWAAIEPARGELTFAQMDDLAAFARSHSQKVRGHTLLWHRSVPDWAVPILRDQHDWSLITKLFASVIPRYGDIISQWDVVNEPIETGHRMDGLRDSVFLQAFGPNYINQALEAARLYAPHGHLMINEYGLEYDTQEQKDRRYLLLRLIERLRSAGAPLNGVGLQSHLDLCKGSISQRSVTQLLDELGNFGLDVVVTELDVKECAYTAPPAVRDQRVADEVRRYLDTVLPHPCVRGVVTWGLSDRNSWLTLTPEDYARFPNTWRNGQGPGLNRGLPYDSSMQKTPMYWAVRSGLLHR